MSEKFNVNEEPLLRVEDLCQYFPMGNKELHAVDHVSFDIKKGEVFGLVGESGCGKTTTGRSIIKIYDITGGNIYFKGQNAILKAMKTGSFMSLPIRNRQSVRIHATTTCHTWNLCHSK